MKVIISIYILGVILLGVSLFQEPRLKESIARGSDIYTDFCITCHLEKGEGIAYVFPPLANSDYLNQNRNASIKGVKYGLQGAIKVNGISYNSNMAPLGLEDEEVADVMNFILNSWGNTSDKMVTTEEVKTITK